MLWPVYGKYLKSPWDAWLFLHANNGDYRLISLTLATPTTQRSIIIADRAYGIAGREGDW